ncbi:MAG TPA: metal-dependent transcriptional regulator [Candidatus Dormibacteraeota bacterium]
MPSEVISRYLEAIYYMRAEGETVTNARLAEWLGVSRPTVTAGLRRMARDGLLRLDSGKEVLFTEEGETQAAAIVRRHRIVERWLTDSLGLDWVVADQEAARLEHTISEVVEKRLYEALGRPSSCPHGNPIPGHSEPVSGEVRLAGLTGGAATVTRISEVAEREAPSLLHYLHERNLVPGTRLALLEVDGVGNTIRLRAAEREVTLSLDTAAKVWVLPE